MSTFTQEEALLIEYHLLTAPGAQQLYELTKTGKRSVNEKLTIADSQISRCEYCGDHTISKLKRCSWCISHGYPVIR